MRKLPLLLLLVALLTACLPSPQPLTYYNWAYADLITLDPADTLDAELDLIAAYQRADPRELQIRLDFLELNPNRDFDLYLALNLFPGGTRMLPLNATASLDWDTLVVVPANGQPVALDPALRPRPELIPRVVRDPDLDMLVISLVQPVLRADIDTLEMEIILTPAGDPYPADRVAAPGQEDPDPGRAPVLLAFWNTFPAYSPAQALRRWDGAHTGPFGERHGLSQVIASAGAYKVPVTLLDLKSPLFLSALDFMGKIPAIRSLSETGLLTLPDVIPLPHTAAAGGLPFVPPPYALVQGAAMSQEAAAAFGLPTNPLLYAPLAPEDLPGDYQAVFLPAPGQDDPATPPQFELAQWAGQTVIPLPLTVDPFQATPDGLAFPIREKLVELALLAKSPTSLTDGPIVFLGGDLPSSAWGDPQAGRAAMRYIAEHPWIWPVKGSDLLAVRPSAQATPPPAPILPEAILNTLQGEPNPAGLTADQVQMEILAGLVRTPPGAARDLAWSAYFALLAPNPPFGDELGELRRGYLGQVGALLAAARWAAAPAPLVDCAEDLDYDGQPECILANENIFTVFEPEGARLSVGFILTQEGVVQWIAPLSQFLVGLSDSADWELARGPAGDPADVPGAFSETRARFAPYAVTALPEGLQFTAPSAGMKKTYTLTPAGIKALIQSQESGEYTVQIPLALDPETRFSPGWGARCQAAVLPPGFTWQAGDNALLRVITSGSTSLVTFIDSSSYLAEPEDPNFDYPPGHFVPFPLAIGAISAQGDLEIEIQVSIP